MKVTLIAAADREGTIGRGGGLPWSIPSDLARFRTRTIGRAVIMGRRTWESLPSRPLPGRLNVVVTRNPGHGAAVAGSVEGALEAARTAGHEEACVIGGGEIYALALPFADAIEITRVAGRTEGDVRFPALDPDEWTLTSVQNLQGDPRDSHATSLEIHVRKRP